MGKSLMDGTKAEWMQEARPSWSVAEYGEQTHADDRRHESETAEVPVVFLYRLVSPIDNSVELIPNAGDVTIVATQRIGGDDIWVSIGRDRQRL
ncbi:MAG: hypothetical protein ABI130_03130, partial [Leifsonia sp.]